MLTELAIKYGTDKAGPYTEFYDRMFGSRRETIKSVLEIGIGSMEAMKHVPGYQPGASLRMWQEYFPNAMIVGLDIDDSVLVEGPRIRSYLRSRDFPLGPYDFILDDANHSPEEQIRTWREFHGLLVPGGIYIIEDASPKGDFSALGPHVFVSFRFQREDALILI
jgi:hypothetical protein